MKKLVVITLLESVRYAQASFEEKKAKGTYSSEAVSLLAVTYLSGIASNLAFSIDLLKFSGMKSDDLGIKQLSEFIDGFLSEIFVFQMTGTKGLGRNIDNLIQYLEHVKAKL